jgi:hypothetical protein
MADFNKFQDFTEQLAKGLHHLHAAGDTLKVYLTNNAPSAADDAGKGDLAGITEETGYQAADIQNDMSETGGVATITGVDVEWTATGAVGPFRYAVLYNDTHASDALIGWWDYGSAVTLANGEKFKVDFGASVFTIT